MLQALFSLDKDFLSYVKFKKKFRCKRPFNAHKASTLIQSMPGADINLIECQATPRPGGAMSMSCPPSIKTYCSF